MFFLVCLIKYARKRFKKHAMEGLSVSEQVEYIFEKYTHMKKKDERKILSGWFLIALLLLVGVLVSRMTMKENLIISIVVFVIMEAFFASCAISKVKQEEELYYIWLARSEYGKKLVEASLMLENLQEQRKLHSINFCYNIYYTK